MRKSVMVQRKGGLFWHPADTPEKVAANFFSKVIVVKSGCWEWQGGLHDKGYGQFNGDGDQFAHRWSYKTFVGDLKPFPMTIDHLCRNKLCVNPLHLEQVPLKENIRRSNKFPSNKPAYKTHCKNGHEFTPENTVRKYGWRECRICKNAIYRKWYDKHKKEARSK